MLASFPKFPKTLSPKALKIDVLITSLSFDGPPGNPANITIIKPHIARNLSLGNIFAADSVVPSSFKFLWWAPKTHVFWNRVCNGRSKSSKVVDFGINRKRVCHFLLVINSNFGPILPRFGDITGFRLKTATPPLFHQNFGGCSLWTTLPMLGLRGAKT